MDANCGLAAKDKYTELAALTMHGSDWSQHTDSIFSTTAEK